MLLKNSIDLKLKSIKLQKLLSGCCRGYLRRIDNIQSGSRTAATSKMEHFVIIVNSFQSLTIITKCSILDVATVLDPPLISLF